MQVWQERATDKRTMEVETRKLYELFQESDEDDLNSEEDDNETEDEIVPSDFEGFSSDDSSILEGFPEI